MPHRIAICYHQPSKPSSAQPLTPSVQASWPPPARVRDCEQPSLTVAAACSPGHSAACEQASPLLLLPAGQSTAAPCPLPDLFLALLGAERLDCSRGLEHRSGNTRGRGKEEREVVGGDGEPNSLGMFAERRRGNAEQDKEASQEESLLDRVFTIVLLNLPNQNDLARLLELL